VPHCENEATTAIKFIPVKQAGKEQKTQRRHTGTPCKTMWCSEYMEETQKSSVIISWMIMKIN
jgi:hypothetical protein